MKMSDKDFDQLFNSKLADMEMEPSANVWSNIADELDGKQKEKKAGIPFMRIAATIVVVMGVSLFFLRPKQQILQLHAAAGQTANVVTDGPASRPSVVQPTTDAVTKQISSTQTVVKHQIAQVASTPVAINTRSVFSQGDTATRALQNTTAAITQAVNTNTQIIAQVTPVTTQTLDVKNNNISPKTNTIDPDKNMIKTPALAENLTNKPTEPVRKKRIHTLGDLLNVVIAKVDKRENKLIEFTNTTDDGDSFNVTGVNLGLVRAKREN